MDISRLESRIRAFLRTELGVDAGDLAPETPLVTTGLVDSAGLVRLAAVIEDETGIVIPDRDITADNFDTMGQMMAYLRGRIGA